MGRALLAIVLAPIIWGAVGVPANLLLMAFYGELVTNAATPDLIPTSYLVLSVLLSCGYSLVSGYCAVWIAAGRTTLTAIGSAIAVMVVGIAVQLGAWDTLPVWFHLVFLGLLMPGTLLGARWRATTRPVTP